MKSASHKTGQGKAFQTLVDIVSSIPECARSEIFGLSLTDGKHPDETTCHILQAIRKELAVFMPTDDLPRLTVEAHELDDTRNNIEVAFAIDQILRRSQDEGADQTSCEQHG